MGQNEKDNPILKQQGKRNEVLFKIIGIIFVLLAIIVTIGIKCPTSAQYFGIYASFSVGVASFFAKSAEKSRMKFTEPIHNIKIVLYGKVALPFILFLTNPIGKFKNGDCPIYTNITVSVHGNHGIQDIILDKGSVVMDIIRKDKRSSAINEYGQAFFQNLAIGDSVKLSIKYSEPYNPINPDSIYVIKTNETLYLPVKLVGIDRIYGGAQYNYVPLPGVKVEVQGKTGYLDTLTDASGRFSISIPEKMQQKAYVVIFRKQGFKTDTLTAIPQTGQRLTAIMTKK